MRNYLGLGNLLRAYLQHAAGNRLGALKCAYRYRRGGYRLIPIVDVIYVGYIGNVGYVCDVGGVDVGDVDLTQVVVAVMIGGIVRLPRSQRKPRSNTTPSEANGKPSAANKGYESRPVDRSRGDRSR